MMSLTDCTSDPILETEWAVTSSVECIQAQQKPSRINGSRSCDPVTKEGRLRSTQNTIRHGILCGKSSPPIEHACDDVQIRPVHREVLDEVGTAIVHRDSKAGELYPTSDNNDFCRRMRAGDGPAWRWQRVQNLMMAGRRPDKHDDEATKIAWRMFKSLNATPGVRASHRRRYGMWLQAYEIYTTNGPQRWEIEARLLTGASAADIATPLKITAEVVDAYSTVFFDVIGRLQAHDWIWCTAVRVGLWEPSKPTEADLWRYFAFNGGSFVLDVLVSDYLGRVEPVYPDRHQVAEDIRTLFHFTTTSMADKREYRRVMDRMWQILATRITIVDEAQFQQVFGQMELLDIAAGLRKAPSDRKERRRSARKTKATEAGEHQQSAAAAFGEWSDTALKIAATGLMIPMKQPQLDR